MIKSRTRLFFREFQAMTPIEYVNYLVLRSDNKETMDKAYKFISEVVPADYADRVEEEFERRSKEGKNLEKSVSKNDEKI